MLKLSYFKLRRQTPTPTTDNNERTAYVELHFSPFLPFCRINSLLLTRLHLSLPGPGKKTLHTSRISREEILRIRQFYVPYTTIIRLQAFDLTRFLIISIRTSTRQPSRSSLDQLAKVATCFGSFSCAAFAVGVGVTIHTASHSPFCFVSFFHFRETHLALEGFRI